MITSSPLVGARTVLTGASSGIGWALAQALAEQRARLVLAGRNQERLEALLADIRGRGGEAVSCPTDVTDAPQRTRLIETAEGAFGGVDILINNAGVGAVGSFNNASEDRLRQLFEVNFFAATELTRLALPLLQSGRDPMIVNMGSVLGRRGLPGSSEYSATKFALTGWTEALRAELHGRGVHVLLVCPGYVDTNFQQNMITTRARRPSTRRGMTADRCAQLVVRAMRRRQNEATIASLSIKAQVWLNRILPRVFDYLMARRARLRNKESASLTDRAESERVCAQSTAPNPL
jgi:short-subunit dehydrogenase